jgi:metal-responsive CopG/Arc/MetJ family transcriptional regulator
MNKNIQDDCVLAVRVPKELLIKFREKCNKEYKKMSEALRECIRNYINEK